MSDAVVNGSGGIPLAGREVEYATELWLADPSAFWLHPEGPLSDTTPDEWRAKQPKPSQPSTCLSHYAPASLQSIIALQMVQAQSQNLLHQSQLANQQRNSQYANMLGGLFGRSFF